jgi:hypothetical protein
MKRSGPKEAFTGDRTLLCRQQKKQMWRSANLEEAILTEKHAFSGISRNYSILSLKYTRHQVTLRREKMVAMDFDGFFSMVWIAISTLLRAIRAGGPLHFNSELSHRHYS